GCAAVSAGPAAASAGDDTELADSDGFSSPERTRVPRKTAAIHPTIRHWTASTTPCAVASADTSGNACRSSTEGSIPATDDQRRGATRGEALMVAMSTPVLRTHVLHERMFDFYQMGPTRFHTCRTCV